MSIDVAEHLVRVRDPDGRNEHYIHPRLIVMLDGRKRYCKYDDLVSGEVRDAEVLTPAE